MKHGCIAVLLCIGLMLPTPAGAAAEDEAYRDALVDLVLLLQQQVAALSAVRDERVPVTAGSISGMTLNTPDARVRGTSTVWPRTVDPDGIYESEFYDGRYVAVYAIEGGRLRGTHGYPDDLHTWIYGVLAEVAGRPFLSTYIAEFRIYYDEGATIDAFIDQIGASNRWIIGVNLYGIEGRDRSTLEFLRELFIHEAAHVIIHNEPTVRDTFFERFWDDADRRRARRVEQSNDPYEIIRPHYREHRSDYVTEYAAMNPLEDMAESFTYFVLSGTHGLSGNAEKKVRFFEAYPVFTAAKRDILRRLDG